MNRVTAVSTPGGTADVTTTYYADGAVNTLTAANPGGNNVTTTYTYNKRRLLTGESSTNGSSSLFTLGYGYNANGHLGALTYPDGKIVSYAPDALGRATAVTDSDGRTYASGITYYANGAIAGFTYGNGIVHTLTKNARQLPSRSQDLDGSTKILDDTYAFDANGNVDYVTDALPATATNRSRDLGYDALDRLIVADAANQWDTATFSYDALDNIRSADVGTRQYRYNYDAATNRLLNIKNPAGVQQFAFNYDARGNTLTKTGQTFAFDYGNRLNEVTGSQVYRYDGQGRRVQTTDVADSKTTFWIYSQSGQVLYTSEARRNQNISYIYLGNTQVATKTVAWAPVSTTTIAYQHTDSLGSIVAETNAAKAVIKRNSYEPYGGAYNSTIDGTGYTGHVMDQATGLTYMQQRYYDPQVGRFLSVDPMASDMNNAWNFNRYNYAANNPYRFKDPDGRQRVDDSPERDGPKRPSIIPPPPPVPAPKPEPSQSKQFVLKEGVPDPSPQVETMLQCTAPCAGSTPLRVTSTSDSHAPTNPHTLGNAADVTTRIPDRVMRCAAQCGAVFQLNEYAHPSRNATGGHVHLQLVPGRGGATGPYYPSPTPAPEQTNRNDKELRE